MENKLETSRWHHLINTEAENHSHGKCDSCGIKKNYFVGRLCKSCYVKLKRRRQNIRNRRNIIINSELKAELICSQCGRQCYAYHAEKKKLCTICAQKMWYEMKKIRRIKNHQCKTTDKDGNLICRNEECGVRIFTNPEVECEWYSSIGFSVKNIDGLCEGCWKKYGTK